MSTKNITIDQILTRESSMLKAYNAIVDGKVHNLTAVRKLEKGSIGGIYRLARVLKAASFSKRVVLDRVENTIQLVSATKKSGATKKSSKKVTA